jgi:hypothetical protein
VAREHGATEIVALLKPELELIHSCAESYVDDLTTGLHEGYYEEGQETLDAYEAMTNLRYS